MSTRRTLTLLAALLALGASLSACGSDTPADTTDTMRPDTFVLDEWSVVPPVGGLVAGKVRVTASNEGTETHELVIVRAADAASLPTNTDGSVNEDEIPESKKAGEIADLAAGKTTTKTFDLSAGRYVAFCNIVENSGSGSGMGNVSTMGSGSGMGNGSTMGSGSGMGSGSTMGNGTGMHHVHYRLGMVAPFTVT